MLILFKWICAHLLGDFTFQPAWMVQHKREHKARSGFLYLHAGIHAALIYLLTGWWTNWTLPLVIGVSHFLIDWWKTYRKDTFPYFAIDQVLHFMVLGVLWWFYMGPERNTALDTGNSILHNPNVWIVAATYLFAIWPCAVIIGYLTRKWRKAIELKANTASGPSLAEAGKWIGRIERVLVLTFVLTNHFEGIGFLIAAKSILRFVEIKGAENRAEPEYILIGTLMSFSISILAALFCRYLLMN